VLDTINTNNFTTKVLNSIQDEGVPVQANEAIFGDLQASKMVSVPYGNLSQDDNDNGQVLNSPENTMESHINDMTAITNDHQLAESAIQQQKLDTNIEVGVKSMKNGP